jgi:hypothetical protein
LDGISRPHNRRALALRFYDKAGFDTAGANLHSHGLTILDGSHFLEVGVPSFLGFVMGVTDIVSYERSFAAELTNL